jgi:hypothetical protein
MSVSVFWLGFGALRLVSISMKFLTAFHRFVTVVKALPMLVVDRGTRFSSALTASPLPHARSAYTL